MGILDVKEVIANFLTANRFKGFNFVNEGTGLEAKIDESIKHFRSLPMNELIPLIEDKVRQKNFLEQSWALEEVPLKYIGGYPQIGDLPENWCQSSILDTAKFVKEGNKSTSLFESVRRIRQILPHIDVIQKYLHPILLPGGEIRKSDKLLSLPFDSDDGNHRLIAMALSGKETTLAYVGIP